MCSLQSVFPKETVVLSSEPKKSHIAPKTATQFIIAERDAAIKDVSNREAALLRRVSAVLHKNNLTGRYQDEFGIPRETQLRIYGLVAGLTSEGLELETLL